jgi:hypothetical protein
MFPETIPDAQVDSDHGSSGLDLKRTAALCWLVTTKWILNSTFGAK